MSAESSIPEANTLLYSIGKYFNPYSPGGLVRKKALFFILGSKVDKLYYYDYRLPEARVPDMLREHFYYYFDIIAYYGPRWESDGSNPDEIGKPGLCFLKGSDVYNTMQQSTASRPYGATDFIQPELPANEPMRSMTLEIWNIFDEVIADTDRKIQETKWTFNQAFDTMLDNFDRKVFSQSAIKAMLIVDDLKYWAQNLTSTALRRLNNLGKSNRLFEAGHTIFFLFKEPVPTDLTAAMDALNQAVEDTENYVSIPLHEHTVEEIRRYILVKGFRKPLPFDVSKLNSIATTLASGGKGRVSFGMEELRRMLRSTNWDEYLNQLGGEVFDAERIDLEGLRRRLKERMIGQERAKEWILREVQRLKKRGIPKMREKPVPLITAIFAGPSGVGKTELTRQISMFVFGKKPLIIPFTQYTTKDKLNDLIGSSKGYVGYGDTPLLTPYFLSEEPLGQGVVILDEFEKAEREVQDFFMEMLDEGRIKTPTGVELVFGNTFIFATTNAGREIDSSYPSGSISREAREAMYQEAVKRAFPSYLLGRFGNTIFVFDLLTDEERLEITKLYIRLECQKFSSQYQNDFSVQATGEFLNKFIARVPPEQGARPIERQIVKVIGEVYDLVDLNKMPVVLDWKGENPEAGGKIIRV